MAENADGQEKSEEPTDKKIREAREKGNIPRSRELTTFLMMMVAAGYFLLFGGVMMADFETLMIQGLSFDRDHAYDLSKALDLILALIEAAIWTVLPFVLVMIFIAVLSSGLLGGFIFSVESAIPKFSKMNPIKGLSNLLSLKSLMELFKSLGKFLVVLVAAYFYMLYSVDELVLLGKMDLLPAMASAAVLLAQAFLLVSLSLIVIALIDVPFQLYNYNQDMKMTLQEVKDEYKQTEGNPEVKGRIRRIQQEMSAQRMMQAVPDADVIVTNPTHFSVALKYDQDTMIAPQIVALGADFIALQIRNIAGEHNIPKVEAPLLARALYHTGELHKTIDPSLFQAVVAIYQYLLALDQSRGTAKDGSDFDDRDLVIPEHLRDL